MQAILMAHISYYYSSYQLCREQSKPNLSKQLLEETTKYHHERALTWTP